MRAIKTIFKTIGTGLMLYGAYCLVSERTSSAINKNWLEIMEKTENEISKKIFGKAYHKPIEAEYTIEEDEK